MAKDTPDKIRRAALKLFSRQWFETVSIAEICREAEVSNGVFYRYYANKDQLIRDLLEDFLEQFARELSDIFGKTVDERLGRMFEVVFKAGVDHADQVTVFREGQYRFPEYEERIRDIYLGYCEQVFQRRISEAEYLYTVSGLRFNSTRSLYDGLPRRPEVIARFVRSGIFCDEKHISGSVSVPEHYESVPEISPGDSRERLLATGMLMIGERGYHDK
jgi:AcrR family transcriptional regulator